MLNKQIGTDLADSLLFLWRLVFTKIRAVDKYFGQRNY